MGLGTKVDKWCAWLQRDSYYLVAALVLKMNEQCPFFGLLAPTHVESFPYIPCSLGSGQLIIAGGMVPT